MDKVLAGYRGRRGTLYLTNRRLIFEHSQGAIHKKSFQIGLALSDIQSVDASHPRLRRSELIITARSSSNGFGTTRIVISTAMNSEAWMRKLNQVVMSIGDSSGSPSSAGVDREVVQVRCRYCGMMVNPSADRRCPQCGAPIES